MPTLPDLVAQNARRVPEVEAVVDGDRRWTWEEFSGHVSTAAAALHAAGLRPGDRFGIVSENSAEYIAAIYGALRLGAIVVPVGNKLAPPEVAHILADSQATVVACSTACAGTVDTATADAAPTDPLIARVDLAALLSNPATTECPAVHEDDDAFITYTSGTTGRPKGVLIDHHRAIWAALAQVTSLGLRDGERYLHLSPFYHSGGIVFLDVVTLLAGTHVVIGGFEPAHALDVLEHERITTFLGVPTVYQMLLDQPDVEKRDLGAWRTAVFGAAPMPRPVITALLDRFPQVSLFQLCGQTEAGPVGLYSTTEQLRARPDSTGHQTQPGLEYRVVDADGHDVPAGGTGEMLFRGEAVMKRYWNRPQETAEALRDGWLHTGDVVRLDHDGSLLLVDRLKDVIITGGQNVYSAEVESIVRLHPAVADCAVIGVPHPRYGETVVAVVALRGEATLTLPDLQAHCTPHLARYKIPRELRLRPIPRNATGKLQKHVLREDT